MRVSEKVTIDEIKSWNPGDVVTISAGCGAGKSYFIKNNLYALAKKDNQKILFLIHRTDCINQFIKEVIEDKKQDIIHIKSYQALESLKNKHKKPYDFSIYKYIVCDEFHYFMGDAAFNKITDISLEMILAQTNKIRIFMSATGNRMKKYINKKKNISTIDYELPINYNFIDELKFFIHNETIEALMQEAIEKNKKTIFFIQSAKKAYQLYCKYKKYCLFNCSKSNDDYYKYVDIKKKNEMLKNQRFEELILISTMSMDTGVNIIDTSLNDIVLDVVDIGSLIQCIGRKRIQNEYDRVNLYIKTITNQQLGGMKTQIQKKLKKGEYFKKHTVKEYVEKYPRENDRLNMVYDITVDEEDKCTKKLNELMYFKCKLDIFDIEVMSKYDNFGYCKYLAKLFGFYKDGKYLYSVLEEEAKKDTIEEYLESILGKIMYQLPDRKELIEKLDVRSNGKLLKKINNLNGALEEMQISFIIREFSTSRNIDGKKKNFKNAWEVKKLTS